MDTSAAPASRFEAIGDIYRTGRTELADSSPFKRVSLAASMGALAFEWGTGNEALLSWMAANTYDISHNPIMTGVVVGVVSFVEQSGIGSLMANTISQFPKVAERIRQVTGNASSEASRPKPGIVNRFAGAFVLGAAVEVVVDNARNERTRSANIRHVLGSSALIGTGAAGLIAGASGLLALGEKVGYESQAQTVVDVASNPLTYVALLGGLLAINKVKRMIRNRRNRGINED
jgi:hypothetical protein